MATSTFDRKLELTDIDALAKLISVMEADAPKMPDTVHPFSTKDRERSEELLKQYLSH